MQTPVKRPQGEGATDSAIRVLVVEDDPLLSVVSADYLERRDARFEVITETTPEAAMDRLRGTTVDCILSDYDMPTMDGIAFLEAVRRDHGDVPFILLTGKGNEDLASDAIGAGATDYLPKRSDPGQFDAIADRILRAVDRRRAGLAERGSRRLLEASPAVAVIVDGSGRIDWVDPGIDALLGYDPDAVRTTETFELVHPDDELDLRERVYGMVEGDREAFELDARFRRDDDTWRWCGVSGRALADDPAVGGYVLFLWDVDDRMAREQELERSVAYLDEFASIISHDLRNPLAVAMGRLELAMEDGGEEHLAEVARAHERMDALIEDVLEFAHIGAAAFETEPVELGPLVSECWRTVATDSAGLECAVDLDIHADPERLRQLLENLLSNAIDHGGADVRVTVGDLPEGFYVEDDGPGIPEVDREAVFGAGHSTSDDGFGFGLSIVRRIAEAHGWTVTATEGTDGGARFEVTGVEVVE